MRSLILDYNLILFFTVISFTLVSFALCLVAEFHKSNKNDLRYDGKLCYLPRSSAFGLGVAALIFLSIAQIIASIFCCKNFYSTKQHRRGCKLLFFFSWTTFVAGVVLMSGATSMSQSQGFGEGWLDGECYLVSDGVFSGSAILGLVALISNLASTALTITTPTQLAQQDRNVHPTII